MLRELPGSRTVVWRTAIRPRGVQARSHRGWTTVLGQIDPGPEPFASSSGLGGSPGIRVARAAPNNISMRRAKPAGRWIVVNSEGRRVADGAGIAPKNCASSASLRTQLRRPAARRYPSELTGRTAASRAVRRQVAVVKGSPHCSKAMALVKDRQSSCGGGRASMASGAVRTIRSEIGARFRGATYAFLTGRATCWVSVAPTASAWPRSGRAWRLPTSRRALRAVVQTVSTRDPRRVSS